MNIYILVFSFLSLFLDRLNGAYVKVFTLYPPTQKPQGTYRLIWQTLMQVTLLEMQYMPELPLSDALPVFTNVVDPEEHNCNFFALPTLEEHCNEINALVSMDTALIVPPSIAPVLISKKRNTETAELTQPKAVKKTATIMTQKRQANAKGAMYNVILNFASGKHS